MSKIITLVLFVVVAVVGYKVYNWATTPTPKEPPVLDLEYRLDKKGNCFAFIPMNGKGSKPGYSFTYVPRNNCDK